jgi:putative proteasome-type protease
VNTGTPQKEAAKCVLISFDSTMKSNISVGLPIDLLIYDRDSFKISYRHHIDESDPYFSMIHKQWGAGLRKVFSELPNPDWNVTSQP